MFNSNFNNLAKNKDLDLYPEDLRKKIDEINEFVYHNINNGVYRCGFCRSQEAYDVAFKGLFDALDRVEDILSKNKYLCGDRFTEADVRLFTTLLRFDDVYFIHFKCSKKRIREYPHMLAYVRDIYHKPGVAETCNMKHIITHYYSSHTDINPYAIIPGGLNFIDYLTK